MKSSRPYILSVCVAFVLGFGAHAALPAAPVRAAAADRVFELRTYTAPPGKLEALKTRFRDHTIRLFKRHGMEALGYWVPQDPPLHDNTLIYVLVHPSREAAQKNWAEFQADPEWQRARADSQKDGPLTTKTPDSIFMDPADFSAIK
jgi:hypothetical protein